MEKIQNSRNPAIHIATPEESDRTDEWMRELYRENYKNAARVIVAGGRDFDDYDFMCQKLDELFWASDIFGCNEIKIISGMSEGADTLAVRYADDRELTKILFPANWKTHYRMAGMLRNEDMLSFATHLIAFWNGESLGTKHMIDIAQQKCLPVWIYCY